MNAASRVVDVLLDPGNVLALLLVVAAALSFSARTRSKALALVRIGALLAVALVLLPVDAWLLQPLEQRFPATVVPARVDGIIVLGGAQQPRLSQAYGRPGMNERAERMTTFLALAREHPEAKLLFSGGWVDRRGPEFSEADTMRMFLREQGFDDSRVIWETKSGNTYENVVNSERLVRPRQDETWLLVTSAADVPRSIAVFRAAGWDVKPVPVDWRMTPSPDWEPESRLTTRFARVHEGLHEWAGLVVYFLLGRTESLFPAP